MPLLPLLTSLTTYPSLATTEYFGVMENDYHDRVQMSADFAPVKYFAMPNGEITNGALATIGGYLEVRDKVGAFLKYAVTNYHCIRHAIKRFTIVPLRGGNSLRDPWSRTVTLRRQIKEASDHDLRRREEQSPLSHHVNESIELQYESMTVRLPDTKDYSRKHQMIPVTRRFLRSTVRKDLGRFNSLTTTSICLATYSCAPATKSSTTWQEIELISLYWRCLKTGRLSFRSSLLPPCADMSWV